MARARHIAVTATVRDVVMARMAAARASAQAAIGIMDDMLLFFVDPDDDPELEERTELLTDALEQLGCATRAAEAAGEALPQVNPLEREPWE